MEYLLQWNVNDIAGWLGERRAFLQFLTNIQREIVKYAVEHGLLAIYVLFKNDRWTKEVHKMGIGIPSTGKVKSFTVTC